VAKYDNDFMRERGDDRAENLRWLTFPEQCKNRSGFVRSTGRGRCPIFAWHVTWPPLSPPRRFESILSAARTLGLNQGIISNCLGTKRAQAATGGWRFERCTVSRQTLEELNAAEEKWAVLGTTGPVRISTLGRAQTRLSNSLWNEPFTPRPTRGTLYAEVRIDRKTVRMHRAVWMAFGRQLKNGETIDHIDRDKSNNRLDNLEPSTASGQRANQGEGELARECADMGVCSNA